MQASPTLNGNGVSGVAMCHIARFPRGRLKRNASATATRRPYQPSCLPKELSDRLHSMAYTCCTSSGSHFAHSQPHSRGTPPRQLSPPLPLTMSATPRAAISPTQTLVSTPSPDESSQKLFDTYPGADIILRSSDSHDFRVPKLYIINSSPVLAKLVRAVFITPDAATSGPEEPQASLAIVQLPDNRFILSCLLTFIFPATPILPSTIGQTMELLSVAQKYEMNSVLIHIRNRIARQDPSFVRPENAFHVFSLAQKYKLRDEALQAARISLSTSMTFDNLDGQLEIMPGAFLYELWKYHQRVRGNLLLDLLGFRMTGARGTLKDLHCVKLTSFGIPLWLEDYIESIRNAPSSFDLTKFHMSLTRHTSPTATSSSGCPSCASISSEVIHAFWAALTAVVHNSFRRVSANKSSLFYK
jgi:hypothetical protein